MVKHIYLLIDHVMAVLEEKLYNITRKRSKSWRKYSLWWEKNKSQWEKRKSFSIDIDQMGDKSVGKRPKYCKYCGRNETYETIACLNKQ